MCLFVCVGVRRRVGGCFAHAGDGCAATGELQAWKWVCVRVQPERRRWHAARQPPKEPDVLLTPSSAAEMQSRMSARRSLPPSLPPSGTTNCHKQWGDMHTVGRGLLQHALNVNQISQVSERRASRAARERRRRTFTRPAGHPAPLQVCCHCFNWLCM